MIHISYSRLQVELLEDRSLPATTLGAVEAMPAWIVIECAGHVHTEVNAEQAVYGVAVFFAAEPIVRD